MRDKIKDADADALADADTLNGGRRPLAFQQKVRTQWPIFCRRVGVLEDHAQTKLMT